MRGVSAILFAAAAEAMLRILVENARRKSRLKRGGSCGKIFEFASIMLPDPIDTFLDAVKRSGLVAAEKLETFADEIKSAGAQSQEQVADKLIEKNMLTSYQAEQILSGQGEECVLVGRYHLLEQIGMGGMGHVFRALDTKLNRVVAVKVMSPHNLSNPDSVARFQREAKALAQLDLPNVVRALDTGDDNGRHFLVMELIHGIGLSALVKEKGPVSPSIAADYVYQTAVGMQHAHDKGLIHRDIKPGNLLLGKQGVIKILDLGLARFVQDQIPEEELTRENVGMGTPDYMAPEQFRDAHNVDPRADIYSLGCTLYFLIAGRVAFPGSSFSEKAQAHEKKEAQPLEECNPEVPAGLALTVAKMMQKRPADRFQNMREVAAALAPYVAGSSPSLPSIKQTASWNSGQLSTMTRPPKSRLPWIGTGAAAMAVVVLTALGIPMVWNQLMAPSNRQTPNVDQVKKKQKTPNAKPAAKEKFGPDVLTVASDGSAQFTSIKAALAKVKSGQKIVVLDAATYRENLVVNDSARHKGITVEARKQATLEITDRGFLVTIDKIPNVTVKGFRLRAAKSKQITLIVVNVSSPGTTLQNLELDSDGMASFNGIEVQGKFFEARQPAPVTVANCSIKHAVIGIGVEAVTADYRTPCPASEIVLRDNLFVDCNQSIILRGAVQRSLVAGNRMVSSLYCGIQLENLVGEAKDILIANNTIVICAGSLRVWDDAVKGKRIRIENNLILSPKGPDMVFLDSGGQQSNVRGPGDGNAVLKAWHFSNNWREQQPPTGTDLFSKSWIPPNSNGGDKLKSKIKVLSRDPTDADFVRPAKGSALAGAGAGKSDPVLPAYIGAVPPQGAKPWKWKWTWDAHVDTTLTVSQEAKDEAQFDSINAALEKVQPGMTIRVLDDGRYKQSLVIDAPEQHRGIRLEALNHATIELQSGAQHALAIRGVADVQVSGFRFRETNASGKLTTFIVVRDRCPGLRLEHLDIENLKNTIFGIVLANTPNEASETPRIIRDCRIRGGRFGIYVDGLPNVPATGIIIQNNKIDKALTGIGVAHAVGNLLVTGNTIRNSSSEAIQFERLIAGHGPILIANNTCYSNHMGMLIVDAPPYFPFKKDQLEMCNNILFGSNLGDLIYTKLKGMEPMITPTDGTFLLRLWNFHHNSRDRSGGYGDKILPLAKDDRMLKISELTSRDPLSKGFLKPKPDSSLAKQGAGNSDSSLPDYIGAVPPQGVDAWDWNRTWKSRQKKK